MVSIIAVMMSMIRSVSFAVTVFRMCGNGSRQKQSLGLARGGLSPHHQLVLHFPSLEPFPSAASPILPRKKSRITHLGHSSRMPQVTGCKTSGQSNPARRLSMRVLDGK